jgi:hypothetical protein
MATTCKLIAKVVVGSGGAAYAEFTSIPATYDDLYIAYSCRIDAAGYNNYASAVSFNGSTSNRSSRRLEAIGTSVASSTFASAMYSDITTGSSATANSFNSVEVYIPNYAGSTNKSYSSTHAVETNHATYNSLGCYACLWSDTSAITSVRFTPTSGNYVQHSSFYLYGITKA